jgi:hypothetical protein
LATYCLSFFAPHLNNKHQVNNEKKMGGERKDFSYRCEHALKFVDYGVIVVTQSCVGFDSLQLLHKGILR